MGWGRITYLQQSVGGVGEEEEEGWGGVVSSVGGEGEGVGAGASVGATTSVGATASAGASSAIDLELDEPSVCRRQNRRTVSNSTT